MNEPTVARVSGQPSRFDTFVDSEKCDGLHLSICVLGPLPMHTEILYRAGSGVVGCGDGESYKHVGSQIEATTTHDESGSEYHSFFISRYIFPFLLTPFKELKDTLILFKSRLYIA